MASCHHGPVDQFRVRTATLIVATALIGLGVGLATGLLGDDEPDASAPITVAEEGSAAPVESEGEDAGDPADGPDLPRTEDDPAGAEPGPSGPAPSSDDEIAAADAARAYIEAIDDRDGQGVCEAFAADGLDTIELPVVRPS